YQHLHHHTVPPLLPGFCTDIEQQLRLLLINFNFRNAKKLEKEFCEIIEDDCQRACQTLNISLVKNAVFYIHLDAADEQYSVAFAHLPLLKNELVEISVVALSLNKHIVQFI
ncbi:hypothetical protein, partial [Salmonella enterica]|uniref:hypothetical protein n=1 Tax=Salmonella enterica TaxID=28901 RepID=UPI00398C3C7B